MFFKISQPKIYYRFIGDIFVTVSQKNEVTELKSTFENNYVFKFIKEWENQCKLNVLDVSI